MQEPGDGGGIARSLGNYALFMEVQRGDFDAAQRLYEQAVKADPKHARNLGNYADFRWKQRGDLDAAELLYKQAIDANPNHALNLENCATLMKLRGDLK